MPSRRWAQEPPAGCWLQTEPHLSISLCSLGRRRLHSHDEGDSPRSPPALHDRRKVLQPYSGVAVQQFNSEYAAAPFLCPT